MDAYTYVRIFEDKYSLKKKVEASIELASAHTCNYTALFSQPIDQRKNNAYIQAQRVFVVGDPVFMLAVILGRKNWADFCCA
jgi:hypothetical protein